MKFCVKGKPVTSEKWPVTSKKPRSLVTRHSSLVTIQSWLAENTANLRDAGIESARLDCLILLEFILKKPREWILAHLDEKIAPSYLLELNNKIVQRCTRKPLAYLVGRQEFYGREFYVDQNVLIPRPESESIITLLKSCKESPCKTGCTIIDIGTGSGCLAITAKLEIPHATVIATDISKEALKIAEKNAEKHQAKIHFYNTDILSLPSGILHSSTCILIANLPYVPEDLITSPEIKAEPALALFSGADGLDHYRTFWLRVSELKHQPSAIITESLASQHADLIKMASNAGYRQDRTDQLAQLFRKENF